MTEANKCNQTYVITVKFETISSTVIQFKRLLKVANKFTKQASDEHRGTIPVPRQLRTPCAARL